MKKSYRKKRFFSIVLTVIMLMQNCMTIAAEEFIEPASYVEQTTAEATTEGVTAAAEEPDVDVPVIEEPVTEAQTTEAAVTETSTTEEAVTEAPATDVPVTETPTTEVIETGAPGTDVEVETTTETTDEIVIEEPTIEEPTTEEPTTEELAAEEGTSEETETTTEEVTTEVTTEAQLKTDFVYEDGTVRITAIAQPEANLPENAVLKARYIPEGSAVYNQTLSLIESQATADNEEILGCICYDVYFEADGVEIEPEAGYVSISMFYKTPVLSEVAEEATDYATYHIVDGTNEVEDVTGSISTNSVGEVTAVGFSTESFSVVATVATRVDLYINQNPQGTKPLNYQTFGIDDGLNNWGTTYFETTSYDIDGNLIKADQVAYCLETEENTPHDDIIEWGEEGKVEYTESEIKDNISQFSNSESVQKILYYGYGGPGNLAGDFFDTEGLKDYNLEQWAGNTDFMYIFTHIVVSRAYYEFQGGDTANSARSRAYFGLSHDAARLADAWYNYLTSTDRQDPALSLSLNGGVYADKDTDSTSIAVAEGNEFELNGANTNSVKFTVPAGVYCEITSDGTYKDLPEDRSPVCSGSEAVVEVGQKFRFVQELISSTEIGGIDDQMTLSWDSGYLEKTVLDSWNLIVLEAPETGDQDVGAITYANKDGSNLVLRASQEKGSLMIKKVDAEDESIPLKDVKFDVYLDPDDDEPYRTLTTNEEGLAYFEVSITSEILANNKTVWIRETETKTGYEADSTLTSVALQSGTAAEDNPTVITNDRQKVTINGSKTWNDNENADGIRPEQIVVRLYADGTEIASKTVTADDNWSWNFGEYDAYAGGKLINYEVEEDPIEGYTPEVEGFDITNTHHASVTGTQIAGTKTLNRQDLKTGDFTFELYEGELQDGKFVNGVLKDTDTNDQNGNFVFDAIKYTEAKTFYYQVVEKDDGKAGIQYDTDAFLVVVTVKVGGENNDQLVIDSVQYPDGAIAFTNEYKATGGIVIDNIVKTLENSPLVAEQFSFELRDEAGNLLQTKKNDEDGKVIFDKIFYNETDIEKDYVYTVEEVKGNVAGITYDNTVYTVNVKITDNHDGTLTATPTITENGTAAETMSFINNFAGSVTLKKTGQDDMALADAEFQLYEKSDDDTWKVFTGTVEDGIYTTDANGQIVVENLPANDYYFVEIKAPAGYMIDTEEDGSSKKYPFTIGVMDGDAGIVENAEVNAELTINNQASEEDTTLIVTKQIIYRNELLDLIDETFYTALFEDPDCTVRVSDVKTMRFENVHSSSAEFKDLKYGKTYYAAETDAEGNVITEGKTAQSGTFHVDFSSGNSVEMKEGTGTQSITFANQIDTLSESYFNEGQLTITKRVVGADGDEKNCEGVFYAGIFSDKEFTELADCVSSNIVELPLNGNSNVSKTVKVSFVKGRSVTLYVTEVDKEGKPVADAEDFHYIVTVEGSEVTMDATDKIAQVVISNCEDESWGSEEITGDSSNGGGSGSANISGTADSSSSGTGVSGVATGDSTEIVGYVLVLLVAAAVMGILIILGRRKR